MTARTTPGTPGLNDTQRSALLAPINPGRVLYRDRNSYLAAWDVRRTLTRIFGFGGWSFDVKALDLVWEHVVPGERGGKLTFRAWAVYRAVGRLTVYTPDRHVLGTWEDAATGDGSNLPSVNEAHDFAVKTAISQALKRTAVNLGDQFGLSLYDDGSVRAVVGRTADVVTPSVEAHAVDEEVTADPEAAPPAAGEEPEGNRAPDPSEVAAGILHRAQAASDAQVVTVLAQNARRAGVDHVEVTLGGESLPLLDALRVLRDRAGESGA